MEEYLIIKSKFIERTNKIPASLLADMYDKCGFTFDCNDGKITVIRQKHKIIKHAA